MDNNKGQTSYYRRSLKTKAIITLVIGCVLTCDGLMSLLSLLLLPSLELLYESVNLAFDADSSKITLIVRGVICLAAGISLLLVSLFTYRKLKTIPTCPVSEPAPYENLDDVAKEKEGAVEDVTKSPVKPNHVEADYSSRLKNLEQLHQDGLMSDAEYLKKRSEILHDAGF